MSALLVNGLVLVMCKVALRSPTLSRQVYQYFSRLVILTVVISLYALFDSVPKLFLTDAQIEMALLKKPYLIALSLGGVVLAAFRSVYSVWGVRLLLKEKCVSQSIMAGSVALATLPIWGQFCL